MTVNAFTAMLHSLFLLLTLSVSFQTELCVAPGPGVDIFDSTRIIGEKQYTAGKVSKLNVGTSRNFSEIIYKHVYLITLFYYRHSITMQRLLCLGL